MKKKIWTMPVGIVEQFQPSEYIAACYTATCNLPQKYIDYLNNGDTVAIVRDTNENDKYDESDPYYSSIDVSELCLSSITVDESKIVYSVDSGEMEYPYIYADSLLVVPHKSGVVYTEDVKPATFFRNANGHLCLAYGEVKDLRSGNAS